MPRYLYRCSECPGVAAPWESGRCYRPVSSTSP